MADSQRIPTLRWSAPPALIATLLFLISCSDTTGPADTLLSVEELAVVPSTLVIADGESTQLTARLTDRDGRPRTVPAGSALAWSSTPESVLLVDGRGQVTGLRPGAGRIKAEFGALNAWVDVTVRPVPDALFAISGETYRGVVGAPLGDPVEVLVLDRFGEPIDGLPVSFGVLAGGGRVSRAVVYTDAKGIARVEWTLGTAAGDNALRVEAEGMDPLFLAAIASPDEKAVRGVEPRGDGQSGVVASTLDEPVGLRIVDTFDNPVPGTSVRWTFYDGEQAAAAPGAIPYAEAWSEAGPDGSVDAPWTAGTRSGTQIAIATVDGVEAARFQAEAAPEAPDHVSVMPDAALLAVGESDHLSATLEDVYGNALPGIASGWASSDPSVVTVDAAGNVTALAPGLAVISVDVAVSAAGGSSAAAAASATASGSTQVVVQASGSAQLRKLSGAGQTAAANQTLTQPLVVAVVDEAGHPISGHWIRWSVASGGGSLSQSTTRTDAQGRAQVSWTLGSQAGGQSVVARIQTDQVTFDATAMNGAITAIRVTPGSATLNVGQTVQLQAQGRDAAGNVFPVSTATWVSNNPGVAAVNGSGRVLAQASGTARIRATAAGMSDAADITVTGAARTLVDIQLTPQSVSVAPGASQRYQVSGLYSDGSSAPVNAKFQATGGMISTGGLYLAGSTPGDYEVYARELASGLVDTASVTITGSSAPPPSQLSHIVITPASVTLAPGGSQQFSAHGVLTTGGTTPVQVAYTASGGSISASGLYSAGTATGQYQVVARESATGLTATAVVWIQSGGGGLSAPASLSLSLGKVYTDRSIDIHASWTSVSGATHYGWRFEAESGLSPNQSGQTTALTRTVRVRQRYQSYTGTVCAWAIQGSSRSPETCQDIDVPQEGSSGGGGSGGGTPTLTGVVISPNTVSLSPGAIQQFNAWGVLSDGSSTAITAAYTATGGSISVGGSYTAGSTTGSFQVVATDSRSGMADTAAVTIGSGSPPPPPTATLVQVLVLPSSANLAPGASLQLRATGVMSDGSTSNVTVDWTATGGTVTSAGLYTAPSTNATYQVQGTEPVSGLSGSSSIIVGPVAPPPPPGAYTTLAGTDFAGMTITDVQNLHMFFHESGSDPFDPNPSHGNGPSVQLVPDATFGQALRIKQDPATGWWTVKGRHRIPDSDIVWFRVRARWEPGYMNPKVPNHKLMFFDWNAGGGSQRIERSSGHFVPSATQSLVNFGAGVALQSVGNFSWAPWHPLGPIFDDGEWYEFVMYFGKTGPREVKTGNFIRRLTSGGVINPGPWQVRTFLFPNVQGTALPVASVSVGENINSAPPTVKFMYWGPWEVVDGSAHADPYGLAKYLQ